MKKAIFGLFLSLFMLIGMNTVQKNSTANLGWAISAAYGGDDNTSQNVASGAGAGVSVGVLAGAELGSFIGSFGGFGFAIGGLVIGAL